MSSTLDNRIHAAPGTPEEARMEEYILNRYDDICQMSELRAYYGDSDYLNFGYWSEDTRTQKQACENLTERLLSFLPERTGTILDVACGKGATTAQLLRDYPAEQVTAINISESQLAIAAKNAPAVRFLKMNAARMDFQDASFDNIICVEAAFHFHTRLDFLREAHRVLKPGGRLVLADVLMNLAGERERASRTERNYLPNPDAYGDVLRQAGFVEIQIEDATEECWCRHYRYAVQYFHEKFLRRQINRDELAGLLHHTYRRVGHMEYYLLAAARKPPAAESG